MSLDGAITNLASWAGNTMMPTMAGLFFVGAVYRYSKSSPFEHLLYGGFASLVCSGMLRAIEGFVQHGGATSADGFWIASITFVNWTANVILPVFALTQLAAMGFHMGGVVTEIYPGSSWIRKFIAAIRLLRCVVQLAQCRMARARVVPWIGALLRFFVEHLMELNAKAGIKHLEQHRQCDAHDASTDQEHVCLADEGLLRHR